MEYVTLIDKDLVDRNLTGSEVRDPNYILRFAFMAIVAITMSAAVFYWRSEAYVASEYQEMPLTHNVAKARHNNELKQKLMQGANLDQLDQENQ